MRDRPEELQGSIVSLAENLYVNLQVYDKDSKRYYGVIVPRSAEDRYFLPIRQIDKSIKSAVLDKSIKSAVLDTGVVSHHPLIIPYLKGSVNFSSDDTTEDKIGHGTVVALILLRTNLDVRIDLYNVKVLNSNGRGDESALVQGIYWCIKNKVRLIRISAGRYLESCKGDCDICIAAKKAARDGAMVYAAAGNEGRDRINCPAKASLYGAPFVIAVGALDRSGDIAKYSGQGRVYAPGTINIVPIDLAMLELAGELSDRGRVNEAKMYYDKVLEKDSHSIIALVGKGMCLAKLNDPSESKKLYEEALLPKPQFALDFKMRGLALSELNRHQEAIACYEKALEGSDSIRGGYDLLDSPPLANTWLLKGTSLLKLGNPSEALDCFDKASKIDPYSAMAWHEGGVALDRLGRYADAITCYDKAIEIRPNFLLAWMNKGKGLRQLRRYDDSNACFDEVLKNEPDNVEAIELKGKTLVDLKRYPEALDCYDKATKLDPTEDWWWYDKGSVLHMMERYREAFDNYKMIKEPEFVPLLNDKGVELIYKATFTGDNRFFEEALKIFNKVLQLKKNYSNALINKSTVLDLLARSEEQKGAESKSIKKSLNPSKRKTSKPNKQIRKYRTKKN